MKKLAVCSLIAGAVLLGRQPAPALPEKPPAKVTKSRAISVSDVSGKAVRPLEAKNRRATLLFFIAHDCPISNGYAPEMARICKAYEGKRVASYVVYVEQDLKSDEAAKHAHEFRYPCPALLDPSRKLVKLTGARMTPEAVLLTPDTKVVYRGRIDNRYVTYGKRRDQPTSRDLRNALDALLANRPVKPAKTPVIGCFIPDA
jgi:hypothetical protein